MAKLHLQQRNQAVKEYFDSLAKKHPQWRLDALEDEVGAKFFISRLTVRAILKERGCYASTTSI